MNWWMIFMLYFDNTSFITGLLMIKFNDYSLYQCVKVYEDKKFNWLMYYCTSWFNSCPRNIKVTAACFAFMLAPNFPQRLHFHQGDVCQSLPMFPCSSLLRSKARQQLKSANLHSLCMKHLMFRKESDPHKRSLPNQSIGAAAL